MLASLLKNLLALAVGCLLAFVVLEIVVRVFFPQGERMYVADPYIRTIHNPSVTTIRHEPEFTASIRTNVQGFVGDDFELKKTEGVTRIAMLGDSFTQGFAVDEEESFVALLRENLNASTGTAPYQVYNFGIGGQGTAHELLTYQHYARKYDPDIVVLQFYTRNDYADDLLLKSSPDASPAARRLSYGKLREFLSNNFEGPRFVIRHIEKINAVRDVLTGLFITSKDLHNYDDGYPFWFDVFNVGEETVFKNAYAETCSLAEELKKEVEKDGATFLAFIIPAKEQLFEEDWQKYLEQFPTMKEKTWDMDKASREIRACFDELGVAYLDMETVFRKSLAKGEPRMYYKVDDHIEERGNAIVAEQLYEFLTSAVRK